MNALISDMPHVSIVTASKNLVEKLLSMNTRNRKAKLSNINRLADDVQTGNFMLTASGIGVSKTGVLLDGQNRLIAIKKAGYPPVQFVLAIGLDDASQRVVDRHAKRSLSDILSMHMNLTISAHMVALANALSFFNATRKPNIPFVFQSSGSLSDSRLADFMADYNNLAMDIVVSSGHARAPVLAALFVYALHDRDRAIEFARDIAKGLNLSEDHPAYRLRAAINRLKKATDSTGRMELFKLAASACIKHSQGKTSKQLQAVDSWESAKWDWLIGSDDIFSN